jgi:ferrous iron transport protein A
MSPTPHATGPHRCLNDVPVGRRVRIESLPSHPDLRERLRALGIRPGVEVDVVRRGQPGGILHLAHGPLEFMLRREHAAEILVSPLANAAGTPTLERPSDPGQPR